MRFGALLKPSWSHLGASGGHFGTILGPFSTLRDKNLKPRCDLGLSWSHLGATLVPLAAIFSPNSVSEWGSYPALKILVNVLSGSGIPANLKVSVFPPVFPWVGGAVAGLRDLCAPVFPLCSGGSKMVPREPQIAPRDKVLIPKCGKLATR